MIGKLYLVEEGLFKENADRFWPVMEIRHWLKRD
jgi:hypothetical protein